MNHKVLQLFCRDVILRECCNFVLGPLVGLCKRSYILVVIVAKWHCVVYSFICSLFVCLLWAQKLVFQRYIVGRNVVNPQQE